MADYYAVLELTPEASEAEIRAAYRRLVRHHHPDLHPHRADAEARMRALNEAYAVLSDPAKGRRFGQEGRRIARDRFSLDGHVDRTLDLWLQVASAAREARS